MEINYNFGGRNLHLFLKNYNRVEKAWSLESSVMFNEGKDFILSF